MNQLTGLVFSVIFITSTLAAPNGDIGWRVVGGENAKKGQFPFIISLRLDGSHNCGGSIITPYVILTAAHCVYGRSPERLTVVAGSLKLSEGGDSYNVKQLIVHERYNNAKLLNDVAIVVLADKITLSENINIVNLRQVDRDEEEECVLSGWGTTSYPGDIPDDLQYVDLVTTTRKTCSDRWSSLDRIYENQTCTLTKEGEGACHGDSGGPLVDSEGNQIGIVSWGNPCATGMPDVFTRVASYYDWIYQILKLDQTN